MGKKRAAKPTPKTDPMAAAQAAFEKNLAVVAEDPEGLEGAHAREGNPITLAPRVPEVEDWVGGQITNTRNAAEKWKANTLRPRKNPVEEAKKAGGKYKDSMQKALAENRFEKGLAQVDEEAMYETIAATPASAVADGVERRRTKVTNKVAKLRPLVIASAEAIDKMPQTTEQERELRMVQNLRQMRQVGEKMKE